jgi:hypothetical protein
MLKSKKSNIYRLYQQDSFIITSGNFFTIRIAKSVFNKQKKPYSDCDFDEDENGNFEYPSGFDRKYYDQIKSAGYEYSQSMCISFCQIDKIGNNCTLRASTLNAPNNMDNFCPNKNLNFLNSFKLLSDWIDNYFFNEQIDSQCAKNCPLECKEEMYDLIITPKNLYPSISKDLISLYINYESLSYLNYEESPSITIYNLVSNIGGAIGLLLGIFELNSII